MHPIVCVVSVGITSKMIRKALLEIDLPAEFEFREWLLNEQKPLPEDLGRYDVLLSSGYNAQVLKKRTDKPVITISPSLYDILLACSKALKYCATPTIITYRDAFLPENLKQLSNMLAVDIVFESYDRTDHTIEDKILKYKRQGVNCIIGSGLVCEYAEKHGMRSVYLFPEESIRTNLSTASEMAVSIFRQNVQNLRLSGVINSSERGIVLIDGAETIFLCNPKAMKCLDPREQNCHGRKIGDFFDPHSMQTIMGATGTTRFFKQFGSISYSVEVIPIIAGGKVADRLLYIEDLNEIQKTEREFRREVWTQKGFFAKYTFNEYRSVNRRFQNFLSIAKSFAKTEEPVVILGETGVGKEVLAQSIHNHSSRAGKAFVAVNCAAIPENLLESELFGYSEGAFTGARKGGKEGYFEMAHMGTIFLDEIGELNIMLQSKLLRVIQEKQVLRVGATKLIPFDARVVVATNKNLWQLVQDGTFRKDLYYRLNVLELEIPPLRERPDDTLSLFEDFIRRLSQPLWDAIAPFAGELGGLLSSYPWPGNVRELENFAHMLLAHWQPDNMPGDLMELIRHMLAKKRQRTDPHIAASGDVPLSPPAISVAGLLKAGEERQIREALTACSGNVIKAAELLGIHRTTLWRKLKRFNE